MTTILAIDPGNTESGWCAIDAKTRKPETFGKHPNEDVRSMVAASYDVDILAVEMIASYGMPVGAEVFETCVWIGRYIEVATSQDIRLVKRRDIKDHHCHSSRANDANIKQALVDRFAYGQPNHGKGTKAEPGWFHGFARDVWQAYALAVYVADMADAESVA